MSMSYQEIVEGTCCIYHISQFFHAHHDLFVVGLRGAASFVHKNRGPIAVICEGLAVFLPSWFWVRSWLFRGRASGSRLGTPIRFSFDGVLWELSAPDWINYTTVSGPYCKNCGLPFDT
jgi:hypothetical protein